MPRTAARTESTFPKGLQGEESGDFVAAIVLGRVSRPVGLRPGKGKRVAECVVLVGHERDKTPAGEWTEVRNAPGERSRAGRPPPKVMHYDWDERDPHRTARADESPARNAMSQSGDLRRIAKRVSTVRHRNDDSLYAM